MSDTDENIWVNFWAGMIAIIGGVLIFTVVITYSGWVTWLLWNWHAAPFTDIRLNLAQTIGATTLLGTLKGWSLKKPDPEEKRLRKFLMLMTISLVIGWIAHLFA